MSKTNKNKKTNLPLEIKKNFKLPAFLILITLFLFSFYIRGIVPLQAVFSNGIVNFAMDDAVYHMRLVEHAISNFPKIHNGFYDAYTLFPHGDNVGWGSLYTYIIVFFSVLFSTVTNTPTSESIGIIGAFAPAIFGSLMVFPVYFIGKELSGYKAGLIGAFLITILPGQFLSRSLLGFSDHHIVEVFFTTFMMLFLIMAFKRIENKKPVIIYSILAGISFGLYLLTWTTGVLFAVILAVVFTIQFIILQFKKKNSDYLYVIGMITYLIAMLMILPFVKIENGFSSAFYSLLHLSVTGGAAIFIFYLSYLSHKIKEPKYYLTTLLFSIASIFIIISFILPQFLQATMGNWNYIFVPHTGGSATIAEGMILTNSGAFSYFGYNFILSCIALLLMFYLLITKAKTEYTLIIVWTIFIHFITFAQNRFAYYYAINVAILSAFLIAYLLDFLKMNITTLKDIRIKHILIIPIIIFIIGFMPLDSSPFKQSCGDTLPCTSTQSGSITDGQFEWYNTLNWLRYNTPEPDINYLADYKKPYNYSINDYGIMSWWDYGHIITYWGHRIPNANPFQSGIVGPSTFLISSSEKEANEVLNKLGINNQPGARYIISNAYMAYNIQAVFAEWNNSNNGLYTQVRTSQGMIIIPTMKYYSTFESRLHIFDGTGLQNYRLIHESTPAPWFRGAAEEQQQKNIFNIVYGGNIPIENSGYVKIFEHIRGANISGKISPETTVTISTTIRTNINRTFKYEQTVTSNSEGIFTFIVPYSTTGPILEPFECNTCYFPGTKGGTNFDTYPIVPYLILVGNKSAQIGISEKDVLEGNTIWLT